MKRFYYINAIFLHFFIFFFTISTSQAFQGKYPIQNFTPSDYKAGIQNIDFAQNRNMTLFVANNLGVLCYNGTTWKVREIKKGKKERSLAFDAENNRLYVGSQGAFGYLDQSWNYVSLMDQIPKAAKKDFDEVWDVFVLNSKVYFCTFQGIYVYDGQTINLINSAQGFNRSFIVNGEFYTQDKNGNLFKVVDQNLMPVSTGNQRQEILAGIIQQEDGLLLFYNSGEIGLSSSFELSEKYNRLSQMLKGKYINHVTKLSDNRLVIATQTAGLFLYNLQNHEIEHITRKEGLLSNTCLRTYQDYSGKLWVGMQNGIAQIDVNSPIRFINQEIDLYGSGYEAYETEEGTYFTTTNGVYYLGRNTKKCIFLKGTEGPAYGMQKIVGKLYAGHHTGLFQLKDGRAELMVNTNGLWKLERLRLHPEFVIGGTYSGLFLFRINENKELEAIQKIEGFEESSRFFEEDQKGRIWVGQFYKGLFKLTLNESLTKTNVEKIKGKEGLVIDEHIILSRINNELYLATKQGVFYLDEKSDEFIEAALFSREIGKQQIYLLEQDRKGNIHVYGENKLGFYKQVSANNYMFFPSSIFQFRHSLNNDLINVSINIDQGMMFNSHDGFIHYQPSLENRLNLESPLLISKVFSVRDEHNLYSRTLLGEEPEKVNQIIIPSSANILQFEVESFQFNEVEHPQFRFYFKGFEEDYGEWTNTAIKEYTNLTAGEYEFNVQTRNYLGEIITGQPLTLKITPPFYKSSFAKFLYVLLFLGVFVFLFKRQREKFNQRALAIENAKELQILEVEQQQKKIVQKMEEDRVKSELRHTNNLLAASIMNLVVKNEFIETIKGKLQEVNKFKNSKETTQTLDQLVKDIDITLHLQEDWEQFEHHFDKVHGNFLGRLRERFSDLTPNEQKLCAFLRLNLNTKEISNLMGISQRGVEVARYRLRKKLELLKGQNLSKFILEY